ncbi:3-dehydro-L-gulonate 2-dehydrogenase [Paenibacillus sp. 1_12]|uniref:3-dehydro-L-gulonate 2-dehydrogenase n=1 Tax=Paenibacillus sp. 1_12 TaxID=1566278 RepID=UPI0008E632C8|nr:3-dehydro-L-gulonate 2-dehydrogenase [Paenibacillus sp. 1_12]SFK98378.1 3-dehydro-L-gulonate 2-dehydrogenase [Paenibacillus sp. 1_12]
MLRVPFSEMKDQFTAVLLNKGFTELRAQRCAALFAEASLDGVYSHGLNRFPSFIEFIDKGYVDIHAVPECIHSFGAMERWDGNLGPGNLNAKLCMERAIAIAKQQGIGCIALRNTNHWMRGGSYGWQAVEAGCAGICWTNTMPNLPPWGSIERKLGNNPIVFAVPRAEGPIVLDMAVSQFSYGQLNTKKLLGSQLPVDGGYDKAGNLTKDPSAILDSGRPLPIGFWKGSGLSLVLDLMAALFADGHTTHEIGKLPAEHSVSQMFIAFDTRSLSNLDFINERINEAIRDLQEAEPLEENGTVRYPGEDTLQRRQYNLENGIPVEPSIWQHVTRL